MSRKLSAANHSRHVDILLRRWLEERRRLLSLYCSLSRALRDGSVQPATTQKLDRFCEILVDYVSAGHFEVYCELFDEGMRSHNGQHGDVTALYRLIIPTTSAALDFNDRYQRRNRRASLAADLSRLGQVLASRFDWEDALIDRLHPLQRRVA